MQAGDLTQLLYGGEGSASLHGTVDAWASSKHVSVQARGFVDTPVGQNPEAPLAQQQGQFVVRLPGGSIPRSGTMASPLLATRAGGGSSAPPPPHRQARAASALHTEWAASASGRAALAGAERAAASGATDAAAVKAATLSSLLAADAATDDTGAAVGSGITHGVPFHFALSSAESVIPGQHVYPDGPLGLTTDPSAKVAPATKPLPPLSRPPTAPAAAPVKRVIQRPGRSEDEIKAAKRAARKAKRAARKAAADAKAAATLQPYAQTLPTARSSVGSSMLQAADAEVKTGAGAHVPPLELALVAQEAVGSGHPLRVAELESGRVSHISPRAFLHPLSRLVKPSNIGERLAAKAYAEHTQARAQAEAEHRTASAREARQPNAPWAASLPGDATRPPQRSAESARPRTSDPGSVSHPLLVALMQRAAARSQGPGADPGASGMGTDKALPGAASQATLQTWSSTSLDSGTVASRLQQLASQGTLVRSAETQPEPSGHAGGVSPPTSPVQTSRNMFSHQGSSLDKVLGGWSAEALEEAVRGAAAANADTSAAAAVAQAELAGVLPEGAFISGRGGVSLRPQDVQHALASVRIRGHGVPDAVAMTVAAGNALRGASEDPPPDSSTLMAAVAGTAPGATLVQGKPSAAQALVSAVLATPAAVHAGRAWGGAGNPDTSRLNHDAMTLQVQRRAMRDRESDVASRRREVLTAAADAVAGGAHADRLRQAAREASTLGTAHGVDSGRTLQKQLLLRRGTTLYAEAARLARASLEGTGGTARTGYHPASLPTLTSSIYEAQHMLERQSREQYILACTNAHDVPLPSVLRALAKPAANMSHFALGEAGAAAVAAALANNSTMFSLDLRQNNLGVGGGLHLARALQSNRTLRMIEASGNGLADAAAAVLMAVAAHPTLTSITLSDNKITNAAAQAVYAALTGTLFELAPAPPLAKPRKPKKPGPATWQRKPRPPPLPRVTYVLQAFSVVGLRELDLSFNPLGPRVAEALAAALGGKEAWYTTLIPQSLPASAIAEQANPSRAVSTLAPAQAPPKPILLLAKGVNPPRAFASQLQRLNVSWSNLGTHGSRKLLLALKGNTCLTDLNIGWTRLGPDGGCAVAEMLACNSHLKVFAAPRCRLTPAAGMLIADALRLNGTLTTLVLDNNPLGAIAAGAVLSAARGGRHISQLGLRGTLREDTGATSGTALHSLQGPMRHEEAVMASGGSTAILKDALADAQARQAERGSHKLSEGRRSFSGGHLAVGRRRSLSEVSSASGISTEGVVEDFDTMMGSMSPAALHQAFDRYLQRHPHVQAEYRRVEAAARHRREARETGTVTADTLEDEGSSSNAVDLEEEFSELFKHTQVGIVEEDEGEGGKRSPRRSRKRKGRRKRTTATLPAASAMPTKPPVLDASSRQSPVEDDGDSDSDGSLDGVTGTGFVDGALGRGVDADDRAHHTAHHIAVEVGDPWAGGRDFDSVIPDAKYTLFLSHPRDHAIAQLLLARVRRGDAQWKAAVHLEYEPNAGVQAKVMGLASAATPRQRTSADLQQQRADEQARRGARRWRLPLAELRTPSFTLPDFGTLLFRHESVGKLESKEESSPRELAPADTKPAATGRRPSLAGASDAEDVAAKAAAARRNSQSMVLKSFFSEVLVSLDMADPAQRATARHLLWRAAAREATGESVDAMALNGSPLQLQVDPAALSRTPLFTAKNAIPGKRPGPPQPRVFVGDDAVPAHSKIAAASTAVRLPPETRGGRAVFVPSTIHHPDQWVHGVPRGTLTLTFTSAHLSCLAHYSLKLSVAAQRRLGQALLTAAHKPASAFGGGDVMHNHKWKGRPLQLSDWRVRRRVVRDDSKAQGSAVLGADWALPKKGTFSFDYLTRSTVLQGGESLHFDLALPAQRRAAAWALHVARALPAFHAWFAVLDGMSVGIADLQLGELALYSSSLSPRQAASPVVRTRHRRQSTGGSTTLKQRKAAMRGPLSLTIDDSNVEDDPARPPGAFTSAALSGVPTGAAGAGEGRSGVPQPPPGHTEVLIPPTKTLNNVMPTQVLQRDGTVAAADGAGDALPALPRSGKLHLMTALTSPLHPPDVDTALDQGRSAPVPKMTVETFDLGILQHRRHLTVLRLRTVLSALGVGTTTEEVVARCASGRAAALKAGTGELPGDTSTPAGRLGGPELAVVDTVPQAAWLVDDARYATEGLVSMTLAEEVVKGSTSVKAFKAPPAAPRHVTFFGPLMDPSLSPVAADGDGQRPEPEEGTRLSQLSISCLFDPTWAPPTSGKLTIRYAWTLQRPPMLPAPVSALCASLAQQATDVDKLALLRTVCALPADIESVISQSDAAASKAAKVRQATTVRVGGQGTTAHTPLQPHPPQEAMQGLTSEGGRAGKITRRVTSALSGWVRTKISADAGAARPNKGPKGKNAREAIAHGTAALDAAAARDEASALSMTAVAASAGLPGVASPRAGGSTARKAPVRLGNPRKVGGRFAFTCADVVRIMSLFNFSHERRRAAAILRCLVVDYHALLRVYVAMVESAQGEEHFEPFSFEESRLALAAQEAAELAERAARRRAVVQQHAAAAEQSSAEGSDAEDDGGLIGEDGEGGVEEDEDEAEGVLEGESGGGGFSFDGERGRAAYDAAPSSPSGQPLGREGARKTFDF